MTTVLCHGCFDLLHYGHLEHLKAAKALGDNLIVSITADDFVKKGLGRPHFNENARAEMLRALSIVDSVHITRAPDAVEAIRLFKPDVYVKGIDYVNAGDDEALLREREAVEQEGGYMHFTATEKWSSSRLIATEKFSDEVLRYLDRLKAEGAKQQILDAFGIADQYRILFVGETIHDVYHYVTGLGKASKEMMLACVKKGEPDFFDGGVIAASQHGDWQNVSLLSPTKSMMKIRYVDADFYRKILDIYSDPVLELTHEERTNFRDLLHDAISIHDVVIAYDFGHGLFGNIELRMLENCGWLAVNAQSNAGNYGFNPVTRYARPQFVCIDEPEARLAAGMQFRPIDRVALQLQLDQRCDKHLITRGRRGAFWRAGGVVGSAPALADGGVDTMGAGDAVLAVTAPLVRAGLSVDHAAFVGNIVGAIKIGRVGHTQPVTRAEIIQTVEALLA